MHGIAHGPLRFMHCMTLLDTHCIWALCVLKSAHLDSMQPTNLFVNFLLLGKNLMLHREKFYKNVIGGQHSLFAIIIC
jgi:hypothetical protein